MNAAEILHRMRERVQQGHWIQRSYGDTSEGCLMGIYFYQVKEQRGGVSNTSAEMQTQEPALRMIREVIAEQYPHLRIGRENSGGRLPWIEGFNDEPSIGVKDVEKVLEKAEVRALELL